MANDEAVTMVRNEDVGQVVAEIPEGHRHVRTTVTFADGSSMVFQEATVAAIVRAYTSVKTHPVRKRTKLVGRQVEERKQGYAQWQLLEDE